MNIIKDGITVAIIDSVASMPSGLHFLGSKENTIQVGTFLYQKNKVMRDHRHISNPRVVKKTEEVLIVFSGSCEVRLHGSQKELLYSGVLHAGDFCAVYDCGVGYTVLEDNTRMLEIKTGPYNFVSDDQDRILL